jgi:hypothetical protein
MVEPPSVGVPQVASLRATGGGASHHLGTSIPEKKPGPTCTCVTRMIVRDAEKKKVCLRLYELNMQRGSRPSCRSNDDVYHNVHSETKRRHSCEMRPPGSRSITT